MAVSFSFLVIFYYFSFTNLSLEKKSEKMMEKGEEMMKEVKVGQLYLNGDLILMECRYIYIHTLLSIKQQWTDIGLLEREREKWGKIDTTE